MRKFLALCAVVASVFSAPVATAQDLLEQYTAFIGVADLHNSKGVRLWEAHQILRQDRANYHRFGIRDPMDEWDRFFGDYNNRGAMQQMIMNGWIDPVAAQGIVQGGVVVVVSVYGYNGQGQMVTVDVYR